VLAVIGETGDVVADDRGEPEEALPIVGSLPSHESSQDEKQVEFSHRPAVAGPAGEALPLVRRLARDFGVDLSTVAGTGPGGRITREDVEAAAGGHPADQRVRLSKLRRTIAQNMARSWREIPHVTAFGEADATALLAIRKRSGLSLEALFVRAVPPALVAHPEFNASLDGDDLVLRRRYDIGVAVDTPEGLMVVVVREADRLELPALAAEIERLSAAARDRTARPEDLRGQTFTISNIGAVGGGYGTPIIPLGTTAILSFGRANDRPIAREDRIEVAPMLPLSLSYDHRVIDGALGRRFLADVIERLEGAEG
jgi:pyruvate dehydrogenase E2 component (dihydrolipoyllysine-residue acetyltransferase)